MSNRFYNPIDVTELTKNRQAHRERQPDIAVLILALFAGGTIICTALVAPILLAAMTEMSQPPRTTYQQCGAMKQDTSRLACYDRVLRKISLHSAKEVHPIAPANCISDSLSLNSAVGNNSGCTMMIADRQIRSRQAPVQAPVKIAVPSGIGFLFMPPL